MPSLVFSKYDQASNSVQDPNSPITGNLAQPWILGQSGVPCGTPPSGTINSAGQLTLATPLNFTYSGGCWMFFPSGAVVGGLAGMYFVVMSSTTVGTVYTNYNNVAGDFLGFIPSGTLIPAIGAGGYTQSTAINTVAGINLPGGMLGPNGSLSVEPIANTLNNANGKSLSISLGGTLLQAFSMANQVGEARRFRLANRGQETLQSGTTFLGDSTSTSTPGNQLTINTSRIQQVTLAVLIFVPTDFLFLDQVAIFVRPGVG